MMIKEYLLIAYHKAPAGRAADLPELLFGGELEPLTLGAEFCMADDNIKFNTCKETLPYC